MYTVLNQYLLVMNEDLQYVKKFMGTSTEI